jgi:hypothetical protein
MFSDENKIHDKPPNTKNTGPPKARKKNSKTQSHGVGRAAEASQGLACHDAPRTRKVPAH